MWHQRLQLNLAPVEQFPDVRQRIGIRCLMRGLRDGRNRGDGLSGGSLALEFPVARPPMDEPQHVACLVGIDERLVELGSLQQGVDRVPTGSGARGHADVLAEGLRHVAYGVSRGSVLRFILLS